MTKKIYWETSCTEAEVEVLSCKSLAIDRYALRLSETLFHPKGGGQPSDVGWIGGAEVIRVEIADGEIIHYTDRAIEAGVAIARVNAERRRLHSKLHSAGHLIGHVMELLDWIPIKAHHWPGEAHVAFKPKTKAHPIEREGIQRLCEQLIAKDFPCRIKIFENHYREVGFGDLSPYGCGGTHVTSTAELKGLHVISAQLKKDRLTIHYGIQ